MNRSILVPLDGSAYAEQSLPAAGRLAATQPATLALVHVLAPPATDSPAESDEATMDAELDARRRDNAAAYLAQVRARLGATYPTLAIQQHVLDPIPQGGGDERIASTLAAWATQLNSAWIVLTTHGQGKLSRFWLGSVTTALLRLTDMPVLLFHPQVQFPSKTTVRRILLPLDGSQLAEAVIPHALAIGRADHAHYTLVRVVAPLTLLAPAPCTEPTDLDPERTHARIIAAEAYLDQIAERLQQDGAQVETRVVVAEHPAPAILEAAERSVADVIALATHGRSGLMHLLAGSVADKVVRGTPLPLVIVCPRQDEGSLVEQDRLSMDD